MSAIDSRPFIGTAGTTVLLDSNANDVDGLTDIYYNLFTPGGTFVCNLAHVTLPGNPTFGFDTTPVAEPMPFAGLDTGVGAPCPTPGIAEGSYVLTANWIDALGNQVAAPNDRDLANYPISARFNRFVFAHNIITSVSPVTVWVGLKNSDDVGLVVDLQAELKVNNIFSGPGEVVNVPAGSSGFNNARLVQISIPSFGPVRAETGDVLNITLFERNSCNGGRHSSGTVRLWFNGAPVDSGPTRDAGTRFALTTTSATDVGYFLRPLSALSTTAGSSRTFIDAPAGARRCNDYAAFGTWTTTFP